MNLINKLPIRTLADKIKKKEITSLEVTKYYLEKIKEVNPTINAVIAMDEEMTLSRAKKMDRLIAENKAPLPPLAGIPLTIKDTIDLHEFPVRYGSHLYDDYRPQKEGTVVTRLKNAGAVFLGLTNSPELLSAFETDNVVYGRTNHPDDIKLSPGGSSGGEGAIIAAGGSPVGIGTDGAGSIRVPAHFCHIQGIKPTQGLVPLTGINLPPHGVGMLRPFGTTGPMGRFVDDLRYVLQVISGSDGIDPTAPPVKIDFQEKFEVKNLKVAYYLDNGVIPVDKDIQESVLDAVKVLKDRGALVTEKRPYGIERMWELHWVPFFLGFDGGESLAGMNAKLPSEKISPLRKKFEESAKEIHYTPKKINDLFIELATYKHEMFSFLQEYDILLCPPCATKAKPHGHSLPEIHDFTYTMAFNNSGSPAVVVSTPRGNVQVVANMWRDPLALFVAELLEKNLVNNNLPEQLT